MLAAAGGVTTGDEHELKTKSMTTGVRHDRRRRDVWLLVIVIGDEAWPVSMSVADDGKGRDHI